MINDEKDLEDLLGRLAREDDGLQAPDAHPPASKLAAYREDRLTPEEEQEIQEHLGACRECSDLLLGLEGLYERPAETGVADFETASGWRKMRARLDADAWFEAGETPVARRRSKAWRHPSITLFAAVLLAVIGFSLYTLFSPGATVQTLETVNSHRGGGEEAVEVVRLPITLLLKSPVREPLPEYRAEILDPSDRSVRKVSGLKENASFEIELPLRRWSLRPGKYHVELLGLREGRFVPVGEYAFRIAGN